jgi:hypothetical protein
LSGGGQLDVMYRAVLWRGLVTVHTRKGTQKYLEVTAWADPTGAMFYQMNPTSAASLVEAASKEAKEAE